MAIKFPDLETILVSYLKQALSSSQSSVAHNVHVATQHVPSGEAQPQKQVLVHASYNANQTEVTKFATVVLDIYANDSLEATELALHVAAVIQLCTGSEIKRATVRLGPVRTTEKGQQERRSLDIELVVLGSQFN